jgi:hypothetical protein
MELDLRSDFADLSQYVLRRVQAFDPATNDGPGEPGPVTRIDFGYDFDQGGWASLVFDTRPDAEPDGEWNSHIEGNVLERPAWVSACGANGRQPLRLLLPDGANRALPPGGEEELAVILGELLKSVLLNARAGGIFAVLPRAARCELGVEEHNGHYGWPAYDDRGKENLA